MNDSGQIVGYASVISNSGLNYSAFLWENGTRKGLTAFIKSSTGFHSGSVDTRAYDINNKGQAVGVSYTSYPHAVLWENGMFRDLCSVDGASGYAYAINNQGQIVGSCGSQSVLWDNGQIRGLSIYGKAINNRGQVVGSSGDRAVLWDNGEIRDLGSLEGATSYSFALNDRGQVVIKSGGNSVLWNNGTIQDLGTFSAYAINNRGTVVGSSPISAPNDHYSSSLGHAFLWRNGKMRDLNELLPANSEWELYQASDINNNGQIVGCGGFNNGEYTSIHAFLLTPTRVTN
jgi:probable HAF family extracellular repeat protein